MWFLVEITSFVGFGLKVDASLRSLTHGPLHKAADIMAPAFHQSEWEKARKMEEGVFL
jgi:hypothetical protein